jgi:3-hydroxyisobutyrate dehydrogenase
MAQMLFKGNFEPPTFTLALSRKDVGLATEVGRDVGVPMPVASAVEQIMIQAMNRPGWSEQDYSIYLLIQEEMAAQEVRSEE